MYAGSTCPEPPPDTVELSPITAMQDPKSVTFNGKMLSWFFSKTVDLDAISLASAMCSALVTSAVGFPEGGVSKSPI